MEKLAADAAATKEMDPVIMQKVTQYIYDSAMFIPLFGVSGGAVYKPYVHDAAFFTQMWFHGWEPANTWIDK
jgi:hypothetical protein